MDFQDKILCVLGGEMACSVASALYLCLSNGVPVQNHSPRLKSAQTTPAWSQVTAVTVKGKFL